MVDSWPKPKPGLAVTRAVLAAKLPSVPVSSDMPATRPAKFIRVSLLDTDHPNPGATVPRPLIECWAETSVLAEVLAGDAVHALLNAKNNNPHAGAYVKAFDDVQGPFELNDPDIQDRRRWQFHGNLWLSTR